VLRIHCIWLFGGCLELVIERDEAGSIHIAIGPASRDSAIHRIVVGCVSFVQLKFV
jgi:hypothetical protein